VRNPNQHHTLDKIGARRVIGKYRWFAGHFVQQPTSSPGRIVRQKRINPIPTYCRITFSHIHVTVGYIGTFSMFTEQMM
jgi:hypothetical protein